MIGAPLAPHAHGGLSLEFIVMLIAGLAIVAYARGVIVSRRAGRPWPLRRALLWGAGVVAATVAVVGPLAAAAHDSFVAHMWAHLLIGMLAPLLLVMAAPVTLALRTLDVVPARRLARLLKSRPARFVAHPITAAFLSAGGLWLIYLTPVFESMQNNPVLHLGVHAHVLASGYLFTNSVIGLDPRPHPATKPLTAAVLVLAIASHAVLAKYLYAHPPAGVAASEAHEGAQQMYYLGGWIEAAVIVIFCGQWYRAAGRILGRAGARASDV